MLKKISIISSEVERVGVNCSVKDQEGMRMAMKSRRDKRIAKEKELYR